MTTPRRLEYDALIACSACSETLTDEEQEYYETRCEKCERAWHDRVQAWRAGADDDLEALFGPKVNLQ